MKTYSSLCDELLDALSKAIENEDVALIDVLSKAYQRLNS